MSYFDVFNGDADGICALHQLRLAEPHDATLVTGTKRDIALLQRIPAKKADHVTVLDLSMDVNHDALAGILDMGATVAYFDHHGSGRVPAHPNLRAHIDTSAHTCTGLIVDRYLGGRFTLWAIVAAFGDNLRKEARSAGSALGLGQSGIDILQDIGESINYNAYGDSEEDLIIHPASLYSIVRRYQDPFRFMREESIVRDIHMQRRADISLAEQAGDRATMKKGKIVFLPDTPWSRRVRGSYCNLLANAEPDLAHAVLSPSREGNYTVSVRAPLASMQGAFSLCKGFETGGGRAAAAGINQLPQDQLPRFLKDFDLAF
ncbi:MAG: acetyltransferase [Burkholderiaceae bacterium]